VFSTKDDLDTAWNWFQISTSNLCTSGAQTWSYSNINPATTRGRIACFTKADLSTGLPQLMFTYDDRLLLGIIIGDDSTTTAQLYDFWKTDAGALVPPSE
jgi:hypothetical protein